MSDKRILFLSFNIMWRYSRIAFNSAISLDYASGQLDRIFTRSGSAPLGMTIYSRPLVKSRARGILNFQSRTAVMRSNATPPR